MELAEDSNTGNTSGGNQEVMASQMPSNEISYEDIATKLLNDNLLLTALELYAELVEAGKDLPKLRAYFSNPGNFEHQASAKPQIVSTTIRKCPTVISIQRYEFLIFNVPHKSFMVFC